MLLFLLLLVLVKPPAVFAVCPICTVAVGAGLGLSRLLGIDDLISGLWVGGLLVSTGLWLAEVLVKKFAYRTSTKLLIALGSFVVFIPFLYWLKLTGIPGNTVFGIDRLLIGYLCGGLVFAVAVVLEKQIKKFRSGRVLFYYQKVVIPVFCLAIFSFVIHLFIKQFGV